MIDGTPEGWRWKPEKCWYHLTYDMLYEKRPIVVAVCESQQHWMQDEKHPYPEAQQLSASGHRMCIRSGPAMVSYGPELP